MRRSSLLLTSAAMLASAGAMVLLLPRGGPGGWATEFAPPSFAPSYPVRFALPPTPASPAAPSPASATLPRAEPAAEGHLPVIPPTSLFSPKAPGEPTARAAESVKPALIASDFRIGDWSRAISAPSGAVRARKNVRLGSRALGSVGLALGQGSVVMIDRDELQALAAPVDAGLAAALAEIQGEMVSFDTLRDRGVGIRYDAIADAVVIESGA